MVVRVGLVGCGTIGARLANALEHRYARAATLVALHDCDRAHAARLQRQLRSHPPIVPLATLIRRSHLVLEAASAAAAGDVAARALRAHRDVLVMSVGGLLLSSRWRRILSRSRGKLYIPSGALAGLDGVKAMAVGRLTRMTLTSRKPPRALASAAYVRRKRLHLERLRRPTLIFEGTPRQAITAFPQNTNIASALTLAGGINRRGASPRIRVVADPAIRRNVHELVVEGDCGRIVCAIESRPSANPKTSELAVRSAVATLGRFFDRVQIGT